MDNVNRKEAWVQFVTMNTLYGSGPVAPVTDKKARIQSVLYTQILF